MQFKDRIIIFIIIVFGFTVDRLSKILILNFFYKNNFQDYYLNDFINLILVWNKGIAFGIFESETFFYHIITSLIFLILCFLFILIFSSKSKFESYSLAIILGGASGNFFDRIYYSAVPDFIDFHYKNYHWFTFNVSDILITLGVLSVLVFGIFQDKIKK